jgi:tetratricopeptide (TPR) repeat protein
MATTISQDEEAQLTQTIEMFEVIAQSQPNDYQSLEILKEAYSKLGREEDVLQTAKRIADAYVQMGQYSSAILEFETILQLHPNDADALKALKDIESRAGNVEAEPSLAAPAAITPREEISTKPGAPIGRSATGGKAAPKIHTGPIEDGRKSMQKIFVESKIITSGDFDLYWSTPDPNAPPNGVIDPFIQVLADKGILPVEKALKVLADKTRIGYLPLDKYDLDIELARSFPAATCQRWCVLPFDRMSKSIMVATANPFNQQAARELAEATPYRLLWFLVPPSELVKTLRKVFR